MAFFKKLFKQPSQEETLGEIAKLQQQEKLLSTQEKVFTKKAKLKQTVIGLKKRRFARSPGGKILRGLGAVGSTIAKSSGDFGDVDLFGSTGSKKKSRKKKSNDFEIDLGF